MVQTFIEAVENKTNLAIVVSDSTSTSKIEPFQERFPERLINVGIAEQNLVGIAAGLALGGFVAVTANAACFLTTRAAEQVKNDICYSDTNVKLVGLNAGVCYGPLASTHHAIDDISMMLGLGNIVILAPSDPLDAKQIFEYALRRKGPVYIRMDNDKFPIIHKEEYRFQPGKADILQEGSDLSIFTMGSTAYEAYFAAQALQNDSINAEVINIASVRPLDRDSIAASIAKTGRVITVEEHSLHGGLGSLVSEVIAKCGLKAKLITRGIPEGCFSKAGPRNQIRAYYKIDKDGIIETAKQLLAAD
ncbi:MAG: transketolase family protein [Phycisphaerae bacterium]|nr:transketolase family protein [Phycisphaerae bacterium]